MPEVSKVSKVSKVGKSSRIGLLVQVPEGDETRLTGAGDVSATERNILYSRTIQERVLRWMMDSLREGRTWRTKEDMACQAGNAVVPRASGVAAGRWIRQFTVAGSPFSLLHVDIQGEDAVSEKMYMLALRSWGDMTPEWRREARRLWDADPDMWDGGDPHSEAVKP